jgi:hypothetical protein
MNKSRLQNMRSGILIKTGRTTAQSRQLFFIETKTDAGSFLKNGGLQIGCGADYKKCCVKKLLVF